MQLLNAFRRYSDFLKSEFLAFTNRVCKQSSETAPRAMLDTPYLTPTTSFSDTNKSRQRVVSMPPREKVERRRLRRRQRWSDSPSLFDHKSTPNFFDETSTIFLRSNSTCSADSRDSEAWMAGGGLYTVPTINERYITHFSLMIGLELNCSPN